MTSRWLSPLSPAVTNPGAWEGGPRRWGCGEGRRSTGRPCGRSCALERRGGIGAARSHPGARCHGNQTSLRRDKQLDILARFLQD